MMIFTFSKEVYADTKNIPRIEEIQILLWGEVNYLDPGPAYTRKDAKNELRELGEIGV